MELGRGADRGRREAEEDEEDDDEAAVGVSNAPRDGGRLEERLLARDAAALGPALCEDGVCERCTGVPARGVYDDTDMAAAVEGRAEVDAELEVEVGAWLAASETNAPCPGADCRARSCAACKAAAAATA